MTIKANIICDSVGPNGVRLTTFVLSYPRFIHSEFMTHRVFSRNSSSSRALPFKRQLQMIKEDMAMPIEFKENIPGMQAGASLGSFKQLLARFVWRVAGHTSLVFARILAHLNVHKQYVNRIIEPYSHITVVCTATEWNNFFALRYHKDAQPEICELAKQMWEVYKSNKPKHLVEGTWHLPFVTEEELKEHLTISGRPFNDIRHLAFWLPLIKRSVARSARVSYLNHDGSETSPDKDEKLYDRLVSSGHMSPTEHQAKALSKNLTNSFSGNIKGWEQFRKVIPNECIKEFKEPK